MATAYKFSDLKPEYARRWAGMKTKASRLSDLDEMARLILRSKAQYQAVERDTGVPWAVVGVWHYREASCNFAGVLHNGEEILGTGRKTRLAPRGRGPFATWHESALDAIAIKGWNKSTEWTVEFFLYGSEVYNGFGYRLHGVPSAYLWGGTNQYRSGKYVEDGPKGWRANVVDQQLGVAPLMHRLWALDPDAVFGPHAAANDDAGPPPREEVDPDDGLDDGEIREIQSLLRAKGYFSVGRVDGLWGKNTVGALSAFQAAAGLPLSVTVDHAWVDRATIAALATAPQASVGEARAQTTAKDLRKQGDTVAKSTWWTKIWSLVLGGPTLAVGVAKQTDAASGYISTAKSLLTDVPDIVWFGALVGVAVAIYLTASRAESASVADVRSGRDAGPA